MVNPFLTEGQVAASLAQQFLDEEKASLMAYARMGTGYLADFGKSFDELKADALVEIQAKRVREAAHKRTVARLADAEREGTQAALAEHAARVKPAPANPDDAAPTHGFDLDTITRTQQEMLDDANEVRKLVKESKTLNERHLVYPDYTAPRYLASQAQPAPAAQQPEQLKPPRKPYRRSGWQQTPAFDYVVSVFASIAPCTWKVLEKALKDRATDETPVGLRHGKHGKFFIRGLETEVEGKTMSHAFPAIRKAAAKLPRNPHSPAKHSRE